MAVPGAGTDTQDEVDDDLEEEEVEEVEEEEAGSQGGEKFDKDRALNTIKTQREAEKKLKKELAGIRKEMKALKDASLPDAEKQAQAAKDLTERAEKAEGRLQKSEVRTAALEQATKLGFRNPTLAFKLIDLDDVDWDDDQPSNIRSLLEDALKEDPYLKGRKVRPSDDEDDDEDDADAGKGRGKSAKSIDFNQEIRRAAGH